MDSIAEDADAVKAFGIELIRHKTLQSIILPKQRVIHSNGNLAHVTVRQGRIQLFQSGI